MNGDFAGIGFWDHAILAGYFLLPIFITGCISYLALHSFIGRGKSIAIALILSVITVVVLFLIEK